jgi:hypothetical protein
LVSSVGALHAKLASKIVVCETFFDDSGRCLPKPRYFMPLTNGEHAIQLTLFLSDACSHKHPKHFWELMRLAKLPFDRKCHRYKFRFAKSIHEFCAWVKEVNGQQATTRYFYVCTRDEKSTAQRMLTTHSGACAGNRVYAFSDFVRGLGKCVAWPPKS